jgi:hypothetical protein
MSDTNKRSIIEYIFVAFIVVSCLVFLFVVPAPKGRFYDCGMAEWHPDIPISVKQECRKIRAENNKEDLRKPK